MSRLNAQCLYITEQAECKVHRHYIYVYILQKNNKTKQLTQTTGYTLYCFYAVIPLLYFY